MQSFTPASSASACISYYTVADNTQTTRSDGLSSTAIFEELKKHVAASPELVEKVNAIFLWKITKDGKPAAVWSE